MSSFSFSAGPGCTHPDGFDDTDYGIGMTHAVSGHKGEAALPYSCHLHELDPNEFIVGLTDGVWDHLVAENSDDVPQKAVPDLDTVALIDLFGQTDDLTQVVERLFEEARCRARHGVEAGRLRECELDDMSAFIISPAVPGLSLHFKEKGCTLA